jgi:bifunctional enzyme CysN/CysC
MTLDAREPRDVNGLFKKARAGEIAGFTGIASPYEPPLNPEIRISTVGRTPEDTVEDILRFFAERSTFGI